MLPLSAADLSTALAIVGVTIVLLMSVTKFHARRQLAGLDKQLSRPDLDELEECLT